MKLVLLPGMDGTGKLFDPFRSLLASVSIVISLPQSGSQSYEALTDYVESKLPDEDFIIIAESFSGPIAALLSARKRKNLKGVVFVATFLACPRPITAFIAKLLPLKFLLTLPFSRMIISRLLLGSFSYSQFLNAVKEVPSNILKERLDSIYKLRVHSVEESIRSLYLGARFDCLVSNDQISLFEQCFYKIQIEYVDGTHFLLQSNPTMCAELINNWVSIKD